jgi:enoyl-[acyl-carrier protein] reductase I
MTTGLMDGKRGLVMGVANDHSIAWGIAQALHREGAELGFVYTVEALQKRVAPLAEGLGVDFVEYCDILSDESTEQAFAKARERFGVCDILIHSMAYAPQEDLKGRFLDTSRDGFLLAHNLSVYTLISMARAARPMMPAGSSILAMTYYGAEKVVPKYKVMGVAKASLEATVRYLADDLGPEGVRVNAISAGPIRTLAASGIGGFRAFQRAFAEQAPLRRNVTIEDVGATAAFLSSDAAAAITGEVLYVDGGYNIMGMPHLDD